MKIVHSGYKFSYELKIPGKAKPYFAFGNAMYLSLQKFFEQVQSGKEPSLEDLVRTYHANWKSEGSFACFRSSLIYTLPIYPYHRQAGWRAEHLVSSQSGTTAIAGTHSLCIVPEATDKPAPSLWSVLYTVHAYHSPLSAIDFEYRGSSARVAT